jgi:hypothetical protein
MDCGLTISSPDGGGSVSITFISFETEAGWDKLYITSQLGESEIFEGHLAQFTRSSGTLATSNF